MIQKRMYAALGATNEAILRTKQRQDLFQRVCDAAVKEGGIRGAIALLPNADGWLQINASSGLSSVDQPDLKISTNSGLQQGNGLAGTAFRSGVSSIANDFQNDPRTRPWLDRGIGLTIGAAAAIPIICDEKSEGVFIFFMGEAGTLVPEMIELLERMVKNVAFALGIFRHDEERQRSERANRRLTDMLAALSATNTAIIRATNTQDMLDAVCEAIASSGRSLGSAAIMLAQPDTHFLKIVAAAGTGVDTIHKMEASIDPDHPHGQGLAGPAFREQRLVISYDLTNDSRAAGRTDPRQSPYGGAAAPLVVRGQSVGILYVFFARTSGRAEKEILKLLADISENVSFALEGFRREQERERYTRMFAALSAINEAIMRARNPDELYAMVAQAAVRGTRFTSTSILLVRPDNPHFDMVACAGPRAEVIRNRKYSHLESLPEGLGLTGTAYRTGRPCIRNDVPKNEKLINWPYNNYVEGRSRSGAALPLSCHGKIVGVLLFMAAEQDTFTAEFTDLLQGLCDNISFALTNFAIQDERAEAERRIQHMATHDTLTGLPNRALFTQLLKQALANDTRHAVLFIDLDRFKIINDSLGHSAGDRMLCEAAHRIQSSLPAGHTVARLGGDEFVVLLTDVADSAAPAHAARSILQALAAPLDIAGLECRPTASIGIAMYPSHGRDADTLIKAADTAMYLAKQDGKNDFRFYNTDVETQSLERLMLESSLRSALDLEQFSLQYQPKMSVQTGCVSGVEALLRWKHPQLGNLSPAQFIPLAEETGLIIPIGRWVMRTACRQAVKWQTLAMRPVSIAVNLSPRQFQHEHLLHDIDDILQETGLAPGLLQIEITESMVMQNVDRAIAVLRGMQARGIRLAIDDFGTGYSSMSLMKLFPIDTIKIDRSFVSDLETSQQDRAIATAIISMGKALGLTVVAEGVETLEQDAFLRKGGCDELQGFLFSRPVDAEAVPDLLLPKVSSGSLQPGIPDIPVALRASA